MKRIVLLVALMLTAVAATAQVNPPPKFAAYIYSSGSWIPAPTTTSSNPINEPPPAALYCFNSSNNNWVPADATCLGGNGITTLQVNGTPVVPSAQTYNFIAGTNITLTPSGNTITITASSTAATAWSAITTGTNTAALLMGTGGSLGTSGSGTITATAVPASGITGTTLASNVVTSSLTTVGTIGTGTWQGTAVANTYGGTGLNSSASTGVAQVASGTWSVSAALANGTTATTQSAGDTSTKVATDNFVSTIFAAPPAIGNTTPAAGSFTTLSGSSTITFSGITGSTQCLHANSSGVITGTGADCSTASLSFPLTVSGTTTSGGVPYFSNATTLTSSAQLASTALVVGGGAGGAPATGNADFTYSTHTLAGGSSGLVTLAATNALTLSAMSGTSCLEEVSGVVTSTGSACGSVGSVALSSITAASGTNTIANGNNYGQVWNWAVTSNSQTAFTFGETTAASGTSDQELLVKTIAGSTAIPLTVQDSLSGSQTIAALQILPTWNTTGVVDAALFINVTNTASGTASLIADFQVGSTSQWKVDKGGNETAAGTITAGATGGQGGTLTLPEGTAATGVSSDDILYADSTLHGIKGSYNNGSFLPLPLSTGTITSGGLTYDSGTSGTLIASSADFTISSHTLTGGASAILNLSAASPTAGLVLPSAAGAVPTADGYIAVNTTTHALVTGSNGTTIVEAAAATGTGSATTCTNQVVTAISAIAAPTCTTLTTSYLPTITIALGGTNATSAAQGTIPNATSTTASSWTATPTLGLQNTTAGSLTLAGSSSAGGSIVLNGTGASPGTSTISVTTAGTTLNLGSTNATVTTAGALTVASCSGCGIASLSFPLTVSGTTTSGGVPYFSNTTTLTSSAALASTALVVGGGAGGAPATGNGDFTYATHTLTGSSSGLVTLAATNALTLSAMTGTNCLEEVSGVVTATGSACGSGGGSALSSITAASGSNTIASGNNGAQIWNWAQTSNNQTAFTFGDTTAATGTSDVLLLLTTLTTSTEIPFEITQGANGPANAAAPAIIDVTAAAAGGLASASNAGSTGAGYVLPTGAGSAGGATTGNGGAGGAFTITEGTGGAAGGTTGNGGGAGGGVAWTTGGGGTGGTTGVAGNGGSFAFTGGTGGNSGTGASTAGNGGGFTISLGAPGTVSSTGTAGTVGQFEITGTAPTSSTVTTGTSAGTVFNVLGITGGGTTHATSAGGVGSIISILAGGGGAGNTSGAGGAGGTITLTTGGGGTPGTTGQGGASGALTLSTANAASGGSTSGTGGSGGLFSITAGNGGAQATSGNGGPGGAVTITGGNGGNGASTGGNGGNVNLLPGTAGTGGSPTAGVVAVTGSETVSGTVSVGSSPPACTAGTAGGECFTEGTNLTNVSGTAALDANSTAHELEVATNGSTSFGILVRSQPSPINQTSQTGSIATATLCAASAGACNVAGQYHISANFWGSGSACSAVTAGSVALTITWTDEDAQTHSAVGFPLYDESKAALGTSFYFATALTGEGAGGDWTISTNGSVIQYATTYTACTTGTGTYNLRMAVTRLQ